MKGLIVIGFAFIFAVVETRYFGSSGFWPESPEEVIADGISLLISAIGFLILTIEEKKL